MGRIKFLLIFFLVFLAAIAARLFYWQVIEGENLARAASLQRNLTRQIPAERGTIYARDGKILAGNEAGYLVFASTVDLKDSVAGVAKKLSGIIAAAQTDKLSKLTLLKGQVLPEVDAKAIELDLVAKLSKPNNYYIPLVRRLPQIYTDQIKELNIFGLGFDPEPLRMYPEGSLAATTLGFVGSDTDGDQVGYFGLEGFYNAELSGKSGVESLEKDAAGRPIPIGSFDILPPRDGRDLTTTIDRFVQFIVEKHLREGVEKFGAKSGTATVIDPKTGDILASVTWPAFDPRGYERYDKAGYKDGLTGDTYEPGSTFKIATMAIGLDTGLVGPDTSCPVCHEALVVQGHSIRTWNNKYFTSGETMTKILEHSNNVGTAWLAGKVGRDKFYEYAKKLGLGDKTGLDIEGEETGVFYSGSSVLQPLDLATMGFGQGFSTTALKILQIAGTIANGGVMMEPRLVSKITDLDREILLEPKSLGQVLKPETARILTQMLVKAVENGEAKRLVPPGYRVAGKTGTAQIAIAGKYDPNKTIASFVGFTPAEDPKFAMIVKYVEPTTTPHGATTAVPTFMAITKDLFGFFGLAPSP